MSTYFITTEQAETNEIFENMESFPHNCKCGKSYALQADYESDGSIAKDMFIVCNSCTENNLKYAYFQNNLEYKIRFNNIIDDIQHIKNFLIEHNMYQKIHNNTKDPIFCNIKNIEIACDIDNPESLNWGMKL